MPLKQPYRIWLRGAFPQRIPQYVDREFPSAQRAALYAFTRCLQSNRPGQPFPGFCRFTVHEIVNGAPVDKPVIAWSAGE
jgi:hypothetical protein